LQLTIDFAEPMHEKHVIGAKRAIDDQFTAPTAVGPLLPQ
jgi:hypothetical protein